MNHSPLSLCGVFLAASSLYIFHKIINDSEKMHAGVSSRVDLAIAVHLNTKI